ncbi:EpsG family protein [Pseudomonas wenzhouensis]|uniref:EpsG family protein n=1 Tax=Pseudomonas wenzhouensis TaxID=2906062 RepID=UPI003B848820|nr:EpsG family protein [Pseudomonas wenzhouensis]
MFLGGAVGVDTATYESIISNIILGESVGVETGFVFLVRFLSVVFSDPVYILRCITFLIFLIFYFLFSRTKCSVQIFSLLVFPVFFHDFTMNGVRYGLSFLIASFAIAYIYGLNYIKSVFPAFSSVFIHSSSLIIILLSFVRNMSFHIVVFGICLVGIFLFMFQEHLLVKYYAYLQYESPNLYSGFLRVFISIALVLILRNVYSISNLEFFVLISSVIAFVFISSFSYAGLRMTGAILYFLMFRIVLFSLSETRFFVIKNIWLLMFIFFLGFLEFVNILRIMISLYDVGDSPYLPFYFIWQVYY